MGNIPTYSIASVIWIRMNNYCSLKVDVMKKCFAAIDYFCTVFHTSPHNVLKLYIETVQLWTVFNIKPICFTAIA